MRVALLIGFVACTSTTTPPPLTSTSVVQSLAVPAGWVEIPSPTKEQRECVNFSDTEWRIDVDGERLRFTRERTPWEARHRGTPPFALPDGFAKGRRHVIAFDEVVLVGNAGDDGGGLYSFRPDGTFHAKLGNLGVVGLVRLDATNVLVLEGSATEGRARWLEYAGQTWEERKSLELGKSPKTFVASPDGAYVLLQISLIYLGRDRSARTVQPLWTIGLHPDSMVIDPRGDMWLGMKQYVLQLSPRGDQFVETWYAQSHCREVTFTSQHERHCVCAGA